jgi:hypothetical protein
MIPQTVSETPADPAMFTINDDYSTFGSMQKTFNFADQLI